MQSHITYKELLKLTSYGIFAMSFKGISIKDKRLDKCPKIKNAMYEGIYTGSPGRDIYFMLPYLDLIQMEEIINILVKKFPKTPPGNHVNIAACIRFIYGQFEKQGVLRSEKDFERMKKEKLDWDKSDIFLDLLYKKMKEHKNVYGLSLLCEMKSHRVGDKAVINKDKKKLKEMEDLYNKSAEYAYECGSYKHMFTPYYWAFEYFAKFPNKKKALFYSYLTVNNINKYCPDARPGYVSKLKSCVKYIKKYDLDNFNSFLKKYRETKNKCMKKVFKKK